VLQVKTVPQSSGQKYLLQKKAMVPTDITLCHNSDGHNIKLNHSENMKFQAPCGREVKIK
jgi:hypothetical protein